MVKIDNFEIVFDKAYPVFHPGEKVSGNIIIRLSEKIRINFILLEMKGESRVWWTDSAANFETTSHMEHESYFDFKRQVMQKSSFDDHLYIGPDDLKLPFEFTLPEKLPTSFEHNEGHIRYWIRAHIDMPWLTARQTVACFTVINPLDLNLAAFVKEPFNQRREFTCTGIFTKGGLIYADLTLQRTGFVPGESILFDLMIENNSSWPINKITVSLIRHLTLRTNWKYDVKKINQVVVKEDFNTKMAPGLRNNWSNRQLRIPPTNPTISEMCRLVDVTYSVDLDIYFTGLRRKKNLSLPVVIGTIALHEPMPNNEEHITFMISHDKHAVQNKFNPVYPFYFNKPSL